MTLSPDQIAGLYVTKHAIDRIKDRVGIPQKGAANWAKCRLADATFLGDIIADNGNPARLYASNGFNLVIDAVEMRLITVYPPRSNGDIKRKVAKLAAKELAGHQRRARSKTKLVELHRAELEAELSEVRTKLARARSQVSRMTLTARLDALTERIAEMPAEHYEVKRNYTKIAQAIGAYV